MRPGLARRAAAEALAAFALVFAGCGAIVADSEYDSALGTVGVGLVFGLIIMVMVYATFTLSRHFPARDAVRDHGGGHRHAGRRRGRGHRGEYAP
jgi:Major intrinsic protein